MMRLFNIISSSGPPPLSFLPPPPAAATNNAPHRAISPPLSSRESLLLRRTRPCTQAALVLLRVVVDQPSDSSIDTDTDNLLLPRFLVAIESLRVCVRSLAEVDDYSQQRPAAAYRQRTRR